MMDSSLKLRAVTLILFLGWLNITNFAPTKRGLTCLVIDFSTFFFFFFLLLLGLQFQLIISWMNIFLQKDYIMGGNVKLFLSFSEWKFHTTGTHFYTQKHWCFVLISFFLIDELDSIDCAINLFNWNSKMSGIWCSIGHIGGMILRKEQKLVSNVFMHVLTKLPFSLLISLRFLTMKVGVKVSTVCLRY